MNTRAEYESVDLTEDAASCDGNFSQGTKPFNFVDCEMATDSISPITANTPSQMTQMKSTPSKRPKNIALKRKATETEKELKRNSSSSDKLKNSNGKVLSVQIKSLTGVIPDTQDLSEADSKKSDTVCIDSDEEEPGSTSVEQQNVSNSYNQIVYTVYTPKHLGRVVVVKKNNKFYKIVIPHNVMSDINQSIEPVLINIPEVGPLVITTDPQMRKANFDTKNQIMQHLLNLNHVEQQKTGSVAEEKSTVVQEKDSKEAALCDKKFCWTFVKGRIRDLEGFAHNDRLGFYTTEAHKARKCWKKLNSVTNRQVYKLKILMKKYNKFIDAKNKKEMIKLPKINEIVDSAFKNPTKTRSKGHNPQEHHKEKDELITYYDSDLLLTKKVVILNENEEEAEVARHRSIVVQPTIKKAILSKKKRMKKSLDRTKEARAIEATRHKKEKQNEYDKTFKLKPCFVQMLREEQVEEACRKHCNGALLATLKKNSSVNVRKMTAVQSHVKSNVTLTSPIPQPHNNQGRFVENMNKIFLFKLIKTEERFKKKMNLLKPILMVHEYNLWAINYSEEFSKNNIIYIVEENGIIPKSMLLNPNFISAVELGYVKLVDSRLFCKFVNGDMNIPLAGTKRVVIDHSYCRYR